MGRIKIALIGAGRIFSKHAQVLKELNHDFEVVGVADIRGERAEKGASVLGGRAFTDYMEMIHATKPDVVSVLTWSGNHADIAAQCAPHVANVIVEKPMALQLRDADHLIETCANHGTRLFVVKQNRYNPPVVKLKKAVSEGRLGRLLVGTVRVRWARDEKYYKNDSWRGTWAWDGGVLTNQASHHIDLLTWIFGPVESVFAKTARFLAPIEAEDTGVAVLKFKSGALGIVEATTCARPKDLEGSISVLGEKGTVEIAGFAVNQVRTWQFTEPGPEDGEIFGSSTQPPNVYGFGHMSFMLDVLKCIREDGRSTIDGLEGRRSLELINAIYESVETQREVFLHFMPQHCRLGERLEGAQP